MNDIQNIGLDIGRGYVKAYSEYLGRVQKTIFKSIVGDARNIDLNEYKEPIYINFEGADHFCGILAEKESYNAIRNSKDSKVSETVKVLIAAALDKTAIAEEVNLMLGVPYKTFNKKTLNEVISEYKGKVFEIKNKYLGTYKKVKINDISIFREGDAALYWTIKDNIINDKPLGMVSVGFRTSELSYFEPGLRFNDKLSKTMEYGNRDILTQIQNQLKDNGIMKELHEIDSSNDYRDLKQITYKRASEKLSQDIEDTWINHKEMNIYVAGGTSLNMNFEDEYKMVDDGQMATAKGLYLIATKKF